MRHFTAIIANEGRRTQLSIFPISVTWLQRIAIIMHIIKSA